MSNLVPQKTHTEIQFARQILEEEAQGIVHAAQRLTENTFLPIIEILGNCTGKVVCCGVGKSGIIAQKISATLSSTGTPSIFLEAMTALHGDLGVLQRIDVLLALSNSGETTECLHIMDYARELKIPVIALVGNRQSSMARKANYFLDVGVEKEAGNLGLAPTTSTTVALAMGDALAMTLEMKRGFQKETFHKYHPSGSLSAHLKASVMEVMHKAEEVPVVSEQASLSEAIQVLHQKKFGVVFVVNAVQQLLGTFTDGDLRRLLVQAGEYEPGKPILPFCTRNPKYIKADVRVSEALSQMESNQITSLAVLDSLSRPVGILHIHDLLGRGGLNYL